MIRLRPVLLTTAAVLGWAGSAGADTLKPELGWLFLQVPKTSVGQMQDAGGAIDLSSRLSGWTLSEGLTFNSEVGGTPFNPIRVEGSIFFAGLNSQSSVTATPNGFGSFFVWSPEFTGPSSGLAVAVAQDLTTSTNAAAGANGSNGIDATVILRQGTNNSSAISQAGASNYSVVGTAAGPPTLISATGFVATDGGFWVYGLGNLAPTVAGTSGVTLTNTYSSQFTEGGGEFHVAQDGIAPTQGSYTLYGGPIFRRVDQRLGIDTVIAAGGLDIIAGNIGVGPHIAVRTNEHLTSDYFGAIFGADYKQPTKLPLTAIKGSLAAAPLFMTASYNGSSAINAYAFTPVSVSERATGFAWLGRAKAGVEVRLGPGALSLMGQIEYLSRVARVGDSSPAASTLNPTGNTPSGTLAVGGPYGTTQSIAYSSMLAYGVTLSYEVRF